MRVSHLTLYTSRTSDGEERNDPMWPVEWFPRVCDFVTVSSTMRREGRKGGSKWSSTPTTCARVVSAVCEENNMPDEAEAEAEAKSVAIATRRMKTRENECRMQNGKGKRQKAKGRKPKQRVPSDHKLIRS